MHKIMSNTDFLYSYLHLKYTKKYKKYFNLVQIEIYQ